MGLGFLHHFFVWPNFWQLMHRRGFGMNWSTISWCQSVIFRSGGSSVRLKVNMNRGIPFSSPSILFFICSTLTTPRFSIADRIASSELLHRVSLKIVPLVWFMESFLLTNFSSAFYWLQIVCCLGVRFSLLIEVNSCLVGRSSVAHLFVSLGLALLW